MVIKEWEKPQKDWEGGCASRDRLNPHFLLGSQIADHFIGSPKANMESPHVGNDNDNCACLSRECWRSLPSLKNCLSWIAWREIQNFSHVLVENQLHCHGEDCVSHLPEAELWPAKVETRRRKQKRPRGLRNWDGRLGVKGKSHLIRWRDRPQLHKLNIPEADAVRTEATDRPGKMKLLGVCYLHLLCIWNSTRAGLVLPLLQLPGCSWDLLRSQKLSHEGGRQSVWQRNGSFDV